MFNVECNTNPILVDVQIDNENYTFNLDTGSSFTLIPESFYMQSLSNKEMKATDKIFKLYNGNNIAPLGYVTCNVSFNNITRVLDIFVVKDATGPPLLGRDFFNLFGLNISDLNFAHDLSDLEFLIKRYDSVFSPGMGKFTKGLISIKLKDENVTPKFFRARPLPFAIREKVD